MNPRVLALVRSCVRVARVVLAGGGRPRSTRPSACAPRPALGDRRVPRSRRWRSSARWDHAGPGPGRGRPGRAAPALHAGRGRAAHDRADAGGVPRRGLRVTGCGRRCWRCDVRRPVRRDRLDAPCVTDRLGGGVGRRRAGAACRAARPRHDHGLVVAAAGGGRRVAGGRRLRRRRRPAASTARRRGRGTRSRASRAAGRAFSEPSSSGAIGPGGHLAGPSAGRPASAVRCTARGQRVGELRVGRRLGAAQVERARRRVRARRGGRPRRASRAARSSGSTGGRRRAGRPGRA